MTELEVLRAGLARITRDPASYDFDEWPTCTCGHVYPTSGAAQGEKPRYAHDGSLYARTLRRIVESARARYPQAVDDLIWLTGGTEVYDHRLTNLVSDLTTSITRRGPDGPRQAAVKLYSWAIEDLEAEQREAMLDVAGQLADLDDVPTVAATEADVDAALGEYLVPA